jgi:hypothetical protein
MKFEVPNKLSSHSDRLAHERVTDAGRFNRVWGRAAQVELGRQRQKFAYRALDQEVIRAALCILGNQKHREERYSHSRSVQKRVFKRQPSIPNFDCAWFTDQPLEKNRLTIMGRLEAAAIRGAEADFLDALKEIDWQTKAESDYVRIVNFALQAGAHLAARQIAAEGSKRYPQDLRLQKQATILAPPRVIERTPVVSPSHKANRDWLKANGETYRGQWVALFNGHLIDTADSLGQLVRRVGQKRNVLFTLV